MIVLFAAIIFTGLVALANLAVRAASSNAVSNIDVSLATLMRESRNAPADELMTVITMMGDTMVMTALALAILGWLVWHKAYRAAYAAGIAIVAAKLFEVAMKLGIQRARPSELAYAWAVVVVAIAYSRIYLGAHWLSDVAAGLIFGTVMMAAFGVAIEAIPPRRIKPLGLFAAALGIYLLAGAAHVATGLGRANDLYAVPERRILVPVAQWVASDWEKLPARRIDLAGRPEEVFVAQYAGEPEALAKELEAQGWKVQPVWTWRESLPYLNPNATLGELPPRPALHEGLKAKLTLTRALGSPGEAREVLRVYKTDLAAAEGDLYKPIYLVSLTREVRSHGFDLYAIPTLQPALPAEVAELRGALAGRQGLSVLAQHQRGGDTQDLITATP